MRISSAPAERSCRWKEAGAGPGDQLRACGEKQRPLPLWRRAAGSAPRLRREVDSRPFVRLVGGISSAPAERSSMPRAEVSRDEDQLRACGEKGLGGQLSNAAAGSAPRLRREAERAGGDARDRGISSAPAERSLAQRVGASEFGDQLRACGEKPRAARRRERVRGSAPRLRREGAVRLDQVVRVGISSAPAERRSSRSLVGVRSRDQLRACGEKAIAVALSGTGRGSAPRLRREADASVSPPCSIGISSAPAERRDANEED